MSEVSILVPFCNQLSLKVLDIVGDVTILGVGNMILISRGKLFVIQEDVVCWVGKTRLLSKPAGGEEEEVEKDTFHFDCRLLSIKSRPVKH